MRIAILGGSGFVGSYVARQARSDGHEIVELRAPRIVSSATKTSEVASDARRWVSAHRDQFSDLISSIESFQVVINCAGMAAPDSSQWERLAGANAVLPAVVAQATRKAEASSFIHVSSAAVQGRRQYLDETIKFDLITPYASSKALGEMAIGDTRGPGNQYIYRATSVQGRERRTTQSLIRYCSLPCVPVFGTGEQPLPLALVQNTAAAIIHLASSSPSPGTYLHPWEGITVNRMLQLLSPSASTVSIPRRPALCGLDLGFVLGGRDSRVTAISKRLDLLLRGQFSSTSRFLDYPFEPALGDEGYEALRLRS